MHLALRFKYYGDQRDKLFEWCAYSRMLYNQALCLFERVLKEEDRWIFYQEMDKLMKLKLNDQGVVVYRLLKSTLSQQCLRQLDSDIRSYIKSIKDWSKNKSKYNNKPQLPKYKHKYNQLIYTSQSCKIKYGYLVLDKNTKIAIPQYSKYKDILDKYACVRVIPHNRRIEIEIIYKTDCLSDVKNGNSAGIDLGVNNLAAIATNTGKAILINGRQIKSINQQYNKTVSKAKKELINNKNKDENGKQKHTSKLIEKATEKRNNKIKALMHVVSKKIVKELEAENVGVVAVGHNTGWKKGPAKMCKKTVQAFQYIPYNTFIQQLIYKCALRGIKVIETEESYTSLCDALSLEPICKHNTYSGKRVKRGLFRSSNDVLINADINGALNIMRNVNGDDCLSSIPADRGLWSNPVLYHDLNRL